MKEMMRREELKILGVFSLLGGAGFREKVSAITTGHADVAGLAMEFIKEFQVPGLSIAIAKKGKLVCREAFGLANIEAGKVLKAEDRFRIASISKPITSAAIFLLIEQRKLNLNDRVFGREALLGIRNPGERLGRIEVYHLLTHTSGGWPNDKSDPMFQHIAMNHSELISWAIENLPPDHAPGEVYAYSNFGYCLLGRIIEQVSGQTYEAFVRENILRPCGIEEMRIAGLRPQKDEVSYYMKGKRLRFRMNVPRMDSHGGWVGTPADLVNFVMRVDGFTDPPDILKSESIETMTKRNGINPDYACGWNVNKAGNWWHNGSLPGLTSLLVRTSKDDCWAACANTRSGGMGLALDRLMWKISEKV